MNKRATNSSFLNERLDFNAKYSRADFLSWLTGHLSSIPFCTVLDVGCGTGAQAVWFGRKVLNRGKTCAFDISESSIAQLKSSLPAGISVETCVGSMDELISVVKDNFGNIKFDLVHSSYSLYYARDINSVLEAMFVLLAPSGSLAISGPYETNTLLSFLSRFHDIPQLSWDCLKFIDDCVLPFCNKRFRNIESHIFINDQFVTDVNDFARFYRSATFFDPAAEKRVLKEVNSIINKDGCFHIRKNGKLVIAREKI